MKSLLFAMLVGLMMVGCGEEAPFAIKPGENFTIPDLNLTMIWVKPGKFMMGDKGKQHQVTLTKGFYLGKHEVTQAQWEKVMGSNPSEYKGADKPVEKVSWYDAVEFCEKLTEMENKAGRLPEGMAYQLPTEAQWEYVCRAGTTTVYSWGDSITSSNANYNWDGGYNTGIDFKQTRDVGQYAADPWGFHDMHGNVWEWCSDWYAKYPSGAVTNPEGPASGSCRVIRGGSWNHDGTNLRSAKRLDGGTPSNRNYTLGFRVGFQSSK
jgi:formylglycine-generating enzyme required for sulfatase activity